MGLLDKRLVYAPFEYQTAYDYWMVQQLSHWTHFEIQMGRDIDDWKERLTEAEKSLITRTLRGFTQTEVLVEDYWSRKVSRWFQKPEIQMMSSAFAAMESVHSTSYAYLQESLGMSDFDAFLYEPSAKAKIDRLLVVRGKSQSDIARSLAIFSAFTEGVNLFSSFAILMSFSLRNLLMSVGQIIKYSIADETIHSNAGCWLFRTLVEENEHLLTPALIADIEEAARHTYELESDFIDQSFSLGDVEGIDSEELKTYMRFRINTKLRDLGMSPIYDDLNQQHLRNLEWFNTLAAGEELQDFFNNRVTAYSKGSIDFSEVLARATD